MSYARGTSLGSYQILEPLGAGGKLWKVPAVGGGEPVLVADAGQVRGPSSSGTGGAWHSDGSIVFTTGFSRLWRVAASGGDPEPFLEPGSGEADFHDAAPLPGDFGVLFVVHRGGASDSIEVAPSAGKRQALLYQPGKSLSQAVYSPSGHLLYARATGTPGVWAAPFSLDLLAVTASQRLTFAAAPDQAPYWGPVRAASCSSVASRLALAATASRSSTPRPPEARTSGRWGSGYCHRSRPTAATWSTHATARRRRGTSPPGRSAAVRSAPWSRHPSGRPLAGSPRTGAFWPTSPTNPGKATCTSPAFRAARASGRCRPRAGSGPAGVGTAAPSTIWQAKWFTPFALPS